MNIDEAIDIVKNVICDEVIGAYCTEIQKEEVNCSKNCENEDCYLVQAIETLINEYNNLKQIEEAHRIENGKLRARIKELEEKEVANLDNIKIEFEIKSTNDIDISHLNTLVLQLDNLRKTLESDNIIDISPVEVYNLQIESMIKTLENMKFKTIDSSIDKHIPRID